MNWSSVGSMVTSMVAAGLPQTVIQQFTTSSAATSKIKAAAAQILALAAVDPVKNAPEILDEIKFINETPGVSAGLQGMANRLIGMTDIAQIAPLVESIEAEAASL